MAQISIDSEAVRGIVVKAIVDGIGQEQRDLVITEAVKHLVTAPPKSGYGAQQPSPLQHAFNLAVSSAAHDVVREMVNEGELKERIRALVREKVVDALTRDQGGHNPLADGIGVAVGNAVGEYLRERD